MTKALTTIMYASVLSRKTVRFALMIDALNDLEVKLGDILNANLQIPVTEEMWSHSGPELGKKAGKTQCLIELYMV